MTEVLCDASVALKWFLTEGEEEVEAAHALVTGHRDGRLTALILDLTLYEVGNALLRGRRRSAREVTTVVDALAEICPVVIPSPSVRRAAAELAETHGLSLYDASYAAAARSRGAHLATADRALVGAGLGERPSALAWRLALAAGRRPAES